MSSAFPLPSNLPVPLDDGACAHLTGVRMPAVQLVSTKGTVVNLAGLRKVSGKTEWPQWEPPQEMIDRKLARPGTLPGGPGNPLGARVLDLDDGVSRINGTNAPATIGRAVNFGCVRLINADIEDLYNRVAVGTRVVVGN